MNNYISSYVQRLTSALTQNAVNEIPTLANTLLETWLNGRSVYICGNGGSAANAIHIANDFIYGAGVKRGKGMKVESLSSNSAVITCLANDIGFEHIYSEQLKVKGNAGDVLLALSGSGNSPNIVKAIETGNELGMQTFAILGFSGGRCKEIAKFPIHFEVDDMQIAEDLQLIVGHMCMQWLCDHD